MNIIKETKNFSYSLDEIDIKKTNEGKDTDIYQFGLVLRVFDVDYSILLEYDLTKETLYSMCIQQQTLLEKEEINRVYTFILMLKEELKSHMKYMLKFH